MQLYIYIYINIHLLFIFFNFLLEIDLYNLRQWEKMYGKSAKHVVEKAAVKSKDLKRGDAYQKADYKPNNVNNIKDVQTKNIQVGKVIQKEESLHPSWIAKKSQCITEFKGTKMTFE